MYVNECYILSGVSSRNYAEELEVGIEALS